FSYSDIQAGTKKTVTTTNFLTSLTSSLLGDLTLNIGGIPLPGLGALVTGILSAVTSPIDQVLASLLSTLG
ncbi:MAG TPA: hypothetical protein DEH75_15715, partial [Bradyrhizobium sp.]|nr:hypothetical protein [Bradyrhizobium sp.]